MEEKKTGARIENSVSLFPSIHVFFAFSVCGYNEADMEVYTRQATNPIKIKVLGF